jgi:DnaJ domain
LTHYDILEIPVDAGLKQIKAAFRKKALQCHPDKPGGSAIQFQAIRKAYEVLSDANKRKHYDAGLKYKNMSRAHSSRPVQRKSHAQNEAKRNAYYNTHIRPKTKPSKTAAASKPTHTPYSDYIYFFWAAGITLGIAIVFVLLNPETPETSVKKHRIKLYEGANPYADVFKFKHVTDTITQKPVSVSNESSNAILVFIASDSVLLHCLCIPAMTVARNMAIHGDALSCYVYTGTAFSDNNLNTRWPGFEQNAQFYKYAKPLEPGNLLTFNAAGSFKSLTKNEFINILNAYEF